MNNKSPSFQFYPGDFLADLNTLVMSAEEIGVYWLLICACWKENGLPKEFKKLSRLARVQEKKFSRLWEEKIKICFYLDEESQKFQHHRLDKERVKQGLNSEIRAKAANARWDKKQKVENANASVLHNKNNAMQCSSSSSSFLNTKEKERKKGVKKEKKESPVRRKPPPTNLLSRIPETFSLTEARFEWMKENTPELDPVLAFADFTEYWQKQAGAKALKTDWETAFHESCLHLVSWGKCLRTEKGVKNEQSQNNNRIEYIARTDAGTRNAERVNNTKALINELLRQGAEEEQNIPGEYAADSEENEQLGKPAAAQ